MMMKTTTKRLAAVLMLMLGVAIAGGCASKEITSKSLRRNLSPGMMSMAKTPEEWGNTRAKTDNVNARQIWDDLDMIFFLDRPMRLTKYPLP